jgi:predicted GIY-YIG superfamily endonuclease
MTRRKTHSRGAPAERDWTLYIVECADKSLYTGVTTDLARRLAKHGAGTGAKYTASRGPFTVRHLERYASRSAALKREAAIKALDRAAKLRLIATATRERALHRPASGQPPAKERPRAGRQDER